MQGSNDYSGRVQLLHEGTWGAVCGSGWSLTGATVVCRQLGFPGALQSLSMPEFGAILPDEKVWWTGLGCMGDEKSVSECFSVSGTELSCPHSSPAGVICEGEPFCMQFHWLAHVYNLVHAWPTV